MAVIQAKPTSAGRRFVVSVKTEGLYKGDPYGPLLAKQEPLRWTQQQGSNHDSPPRRRAQAALSNRGLQAHEGWYSRKGRADRVRSES